MWNQFPVWITCILLMLAGCRNGVSMHVQGADQPEPAGGIDFGEYAQTPKPRLGGLPWPGTFTMFEPVALSDLGHHAYNGNTQGREGSRGMIYTCRGGFIDIAHTRKSIDLCKYAAVRAEFALRNNWTAFRLKSLEPTIYTVYLNYPADWKTLAPAEKEALIRELSIRIGQRLAMLMMTWHETLTWFGYSSSPFPERQSAFTCDDTISHILGVTIGGRALRSRVKNWDDAVTQELNSAMRELIPQGPEQTRQAADAVKDLWWRGFQPLRRQFEWGWNGEPIVARLVPGLTYCRSATPARFELPKLDFVRGRDVRRMMRVEIKPNVMESDKVIAAIPGKPSILDADKHMPLLIEHMKQWHIRQEGPQSVR